MTALCRQTKGEIKVKQQQTESKHSDLPIYLFNQGSNFEAYRYLGAHLCEQNGEAGAVFRV